MTKSKNDTDAEFLSLYRGVYFQLIEDLKSIKLAFGPTELQATLRRRPWIRDFLRNYLSKSLDFDEEWYYTVFSE